MKGIDQLRSDFGGKKEEDPAKKELVVKLEKISEFFNEKISELRLHNFNSDSEHSFKEYARGFNDVSLGEPLRSLSVGNKVPALDVLHKMIENAQKSNPGLPDIVEMQKLIKNIEEIDFGSLDVLESQKLLGNLYDKFPNTKKGNA